MEIGIAISTSSSRIDPLFLPSSSCFHPITSTTTPLPPPTLSCYHNIALSFPLSSFNLVALIFPPQSNFSSPHLPTFPFLLISLPVFLSFCPFFSCLLLLPTPLSLSILPPLSASPQQEEGGHKQGSHVLQAGEKSEAELFRLQHDRAEHSPAG